MAVFDESEATWDRLDYATIVSGGVVGVSLHEAERCRTWLRANQYVLERLDCDKGFKEHCSQISTMFSWEDQFGYTFAGHSLDALNDGFDFDVPVTGGVVLELHRLDQLLRGNEHWCLGLLSIASDYSRRCLAVGRRFFVLATAESVADLAGAEFDRLRIYSRQSATRSAQTE